MRTLKHQVGGAGAEAAPEMPENWQAPPIVLSIVILATNLIGAWRGP
jgi:hypothetical protein